MLLNKAPVRETVSERTLKVKGISAYVHASMRECVCVFLRKVLTCSQCLELECAQGSHCCLNSQPASSPSPWQRALQQRLPRQQWNRGAGRGSQEVRAAVERPLYKTLASRSNSICVRVCAVHPYVCMCRVCVCVRKSRRARERLCIRHNPERDRRRWVREVRQRAQVRVQRDTHRLK